MHRDESYPGFWQAVGVLVVIFVLATALFVIPRLAAHRTIEDDPVSATLVTGATVLCVLLVAYRKTGLPLSGVFPLGRFRAALLPAMAAAILGLGILASELDNVVQSVAPAPKALTDSFHTLLFEKPFWITFLVASLLVPFYEELLFRGFVLRGFMTKYRRPIAVTASALLFALYHGNIWQIPSAFAVGLLLGWWVAGTGSLLPAFFGHSLNNTVIPLAVRSEIRIPGLTVEGAHQPFWLDAVGVVLLAGGIAWLRRAPELRSVPARVRPEMEIPPKSDELPSPRGREGQGERAPIP